MPFGDINITGDDAKVVNAENIEGDGLVVNQAAALPKEEQEFFQKIGEVLPPQVREEYTPQIMGFASLPPEKMDEPETRSKWQKLVDKIAPYSEKTGKVVAAFGQAALETIQSRNPWVAGTIAAIREARIKNGGFYQAPPQQPSGPSGPIYPQRGSADDNNQPPPGY